MERIPTELLYVICSFLSVDDILSFRLVSKLYADVGAAYMLPEVTFHMHHQELERLRQISLHPVLSKHVRSLMYSAEVFHSPALSWRQFVLEHKLERERNARLRGPNFSPARLQKWWRKYVDAVAKQDAIMSEQYDTAVLSEVLPRFPSLETLTMTAEGRYDDGQCRIRRKTPFASDERPCSIISGDYIRPEGKRHLEALLLANANANANSKCALTTLRAGELHWRFFRQSGKELLNMFKPLANLTYIDLGIGVGPPYDEDEPDWLGNCQRTLAGGALRIILKSMPQLQHLSIEVWAPEIHVRAARLRDIIEPGFRWPHLVKLVLSGIATDRSELLRTLLLHRDTLETLCLSNITLQSSSWWKLLSDIRKNLSLKDACICGDLFGVPEDDEGVNWIDMLEEIDMECWYLPVGRYGRDRMCESINMYCRLGGRAYPDEVPLTDSVVEKNFAQYVAPFYNGGNGVAESNRHDDSTDFDVWRVGESEEAWQDVTSEEEEWEEDDDDSVWLQGPIEEEAAMLAFYGVMAPPLWTYDSDSADDAIMADETTDTDPGPDADMAGMGISADVPQAEA
ncbi:hypothetical protein F5Y17DRAFT_206145 [Xylariaceae sp. FL0594]|nr:hypothetical protein F5Y17DRAFT_206145 [Xylariaceae sp. FL0594]